MWCHACSLVHWWRRQEIPLKRRYISATLQGITSQEDSKLKKTHHENHKSLHLHTTIDTTSTGQPTCQWSAFTKTFSAIPFHVPWINEISRVLIPNYFTTDQPIDLPSPLPQYFSNRSPKSDWQTVTVETSLRTIHKHRLSFHTGTRTKFRCRNVGTQIWKGYCSYLREYFPASFQFSMQSFVIFIDFKKFIFWWIK